MEGVFSAANRNDKGERVHKQINYRLLIGLGFIGFSILIVLFLYFIRPAPEKEEVKELVTLVEAVAVEKKEIALKISAYGTVEAHRKLTVQTEVKGRVIEQSPQLDIGGILKAGEVIIKLDPRDYIVEVEKARAEVEKADFDLTVEKGRKVIAEREWELISPSLKERGIGKDLALRIPHFREKEAALKAARYSLEGALINLKRTIIKSPFNALVVEEFVEVGQLLNPLTNVATIVSTDQFLVQVSLPYDKIEFLRMPIKGSEEKLPVIVIQEVGEKKTVERKGYVLRILGNLDPNGRMVQLLVVIEDPLNLRERGGGEIPLLIGTYVEVAFEGALLSNVIELPRLALREGNTVWIINNEDKLEIKKVEILSGNKFNVIVEKGLDDGDRVIVSSISVPLEGMKLKNLSLPGGGDQLEREKKV